MTKPNETTEATETLSTSLELDLGLPEAPATPPIDHEAALAKMKPDFQRIAKALNIKGEGETQEEVEQSLLTKQSALEKDLKENLVPKVQAALQGMFQKTSEGKTPTKPGVAIQSTSGKEEKRVTKQWRGY